MTAVNTRRPSSGGATDSSQVDDADAVLAAVARAREAATRRSGLGLPTAGGG